MPKDDNDVEYFFVEGLKDEKGIIGTKNGRLTFIKMVAIGEKKQKGVLCKCSCGRNVVFSYYVLSKKQHPRTSCGCLKREQISKLGRKSKEDLTNKVFFGFKCVKEMGKEYKKEHLIRSKNAYWECECLACHALSVFNSGEIKRGQIGCSQCIIHKSQGEEIIAKLLDTYGIKYLYDTVFFFDLIMPGGGIGRYDFILLNDSGKPYRIIEYDGEQHYKSVSYFNTLSGEKQTAEERLTRQKEYDEVKNRYAQSHNIPLVRIPYSEKKNISYEMLMGDLFLANGNNSSKMYE